jgi:hypothetical protein
MTGRANAQRRRPTIASPYAPPEPTVAKQPDEAQEQPAAAAQSASPAEAAPVSTRKAPPKLQFDTDEQSAGRIRAAWHYTPVDEKEPSFKLFLQNAVLAEVKRREAAYNNGEPYAPMHQKLTTGPRVGL